MASAGNTPIQLYYSSTSGNTPAAANLILGELALNTSDGALYYKTTGGNVQVLATNVALSLVNSAFSTANAAFTVANNANAIYASGGTIAGPVNITNTTGSATYQSGALVVTGGVGIGQNLNVFGNTIISGSLTVTGPQIITSTTTTSYQNPYIILHNPATGYLLSDDGSDVGIEFDYYSSTSLAPRVVLSGSANGSVATLNVSDSSYFSPNSTVIISGVVPSNFNGSFNVLSASPGQFTYALAYTGTVNTSGQLGTVYRITQANVTGGSTVTGSKISTVTFTPSITIPVGATVSIFGCTPAGYNGTWTVTASSAGSISYHNNSNLGNITVNGYIILDNRRGFFGRSDDTGAFEFYKTGTWSTANSFEGIYGTLKASRFWANPSQGSPASDILNGFFTIQNDSIYDTTSTANVVNPQVAMANLGIITISSVNTNVTYSGAGTLRIQGPPVAGNNVNFGSGNIYSIQVDSGDSYFGGNVVIDGNTSHALIFADGTQQTTNSVPYAYSVAGYNTANSAASFANGAFLVANSASSNTITLQGIELAQNANITSAQSFANGAFVTANSAASFANGAYVTANSAASFANGAFVTANSAASFANGAFLVANSAASFANGAFTLANSEPKGTSAASFANGAFLVANSAASFANGAFVTANSAASFANGAFVTANSAYSYANNLNIISNTLTTSTTTANQVAMLYSSTTYRSAKVFVQITSGTSYQSSEILVLHDGTNTYMTQYADIYTAGTALGSFDSAISGGYLQLLFTPTNATTTVKLSTTLIPV
jgi:hypothetical protein